MYEELVKQMRERADTLYNASRLYDSDAEDAAILYKAADAIDELLRKEKFHAFLWNVINPNDMQLYLEMYHSGDEKEKTE